MGKKYYKKDQQQEDNSQMHEDLGSEGQPQSNQNQQLDSSEKRTKKIKKRQKKWTRQKDNTKQDIMTRQYFQSIMTSFDQSIFFKINDSQAEDIRNRIRNNPQPNNAGNAKFGTKVRMASIAGSILCDPNLQQEQQIKDTTSRASAMLFTIYDINIESINLFEQHVGSKLQDNAQVIFITHLFNGRNQPPFDRRYTIISQNQINIQEKLQDFKKTNRLLYIVSFNLHGKLRLIKFGQNQSLRVCITSSNMSYIDYNTGGNVFWARDFQPSRNQNYYRSRHERDFMNTLDQFLQSAVSQQPTTIGALVNNLFPLDHFKYDRLGNLKLILCPIMPDDTQSTNDEYGLAKIQAFIRQITKQAQYRARRVVNIVSPFKYCNSGEFRRYQRLLQKMLSAFGCVDTNNRRRIIDQNKKLRINQLTPASYYIPNKYDGHSKQEMLHNQAHIDILQSLAGLHQDYQSGKRRNALNVISTRDDIAVFHKFRRLKGLRPSNYTPHHTKMVICTHRRLANKNILNRDIVFMGSQNLNLSSWGNYSEDGRRVHYTTLQLGVLIIGYSNQYIQNYLPFRINNDYNQTPFPYEDVTHYRKCERTRQLNRRQQIENNFGHELSIQRKFFKYLKKMQQWFNQYFSTVEDNTWEIHLYYPITSLATQNQVINIQFGTFQDYLNTVIIGGQQFLANYNRNDAKGFYIADAVFIKKLANNDRVIKYIVNLKGQNRKVSCKTSHIWSMLAQFKAGNQVVDILQYQQTQLRIHLEQQWQVFTSLLI